jgi:DNA-binding GntR family transcriptional regulator
MADVASSGGRADVDAGRAAAGPLSTGPLSTGPLSTSLESASLVELTFARLRNEILSGALVPGERLIEEQLTGRYGISRAPLREALRQLAQQGLVEHLPRRGARVARLSERDADELFDLRDVLERHAVAHGLVHAEGPALKELEDLLTVMAESVDRGNLFQEAEAHKDFHIALVGLAQHHQLSLVYEPVILKLQLYMAANLRREAEQREAADDIRRHRRLLDAVASRHLDTGRAEPPLLKVLLPGNRLITK